MSLKADLCEDPKQKLLLSDSVEKAEGFIKEYDKMESDFKGKQDGWVVSITFRGKNSLGAKVINQNLYYFDTDITKIVNSK